MREWFDEPPLVIAIHRHLFSNYVLLASPDLSSVLFVYAISAII